MKSLWLVVLVCVCLLVATGCVPAATPAPPPTPAPPTPVPPTPAPDLVAPVKAWADAINKGDVDAALAPLADDVTWLADKPFNRLDSTGAREEFRENFDWLAGMEAKYQIKDCQPQDGGMRCTVSVGDGCIAASGRADGLTGQLAFTYQPDGKVRKAVLTIDDPRVQDYARFSGASDAWVLVNRPEEWGKIDYGSRAGGAAMVKLCQEYAESLKAPPTPADPVAPVKAWVDAMNNGDVDAALALFTDDAKLLMGALLFASGKNEVRAMLDADVGRETQYLIKDCQPAEDRVECAISFVDACTAASGVKDGLPMKMVFTLRDGKIGQSVMASEGGEQAIYDLWEHKMEIWAKANRAEEWAQYVAKGETREGESIYAKLCQEYAESLK